MILSDRTIKALCESPYRYPGHSVRMNDNTVRIEPGTDIDNDGRPMIEPFFSESIKRNELGRGIASYGVSSYGYDIRAAAEFKIFKGMPADGVLDYKNVNEDLFEYVEEESVVIPPNGFILARSVEYVKIPRDVIALAIGKSTIARVGINCLCTPLEPGWEGHITLEFANGTSLPNRFYANEGVLQLVFFKGDQTCDISYADRSGKYQSQSAEIILPRV